MLGASSANSNCILQTTMVVFLGLPPPNGYGYSQIAIAGTYGTPIVSRLSYGTNKPG